MEDDLGLSILQVEIQQKKVEVEDNLELSALQVGILQPPTLGEATVASD